MEVICENVNIEKRYEGIVENKEHYIVEERLFCDELKIALDKPVVFWDDLTAYGEIKSSVPMEIKGRLHAESYVTVSGYLKAAEIYVGGGIDAVEYLEAKRGITATEEICVEGYIKTDLGVYGRSIEVGKYIDASSVWSSGDISAGEYIKSKGSIRAGGDIYSGGYLLAEEGITTSGNIEVEGYIDCGWLESKKNIEAGSYIKTAGGISADFAIVAKTSIEAGLKIFAGLCVYREISGIEGSIQAQNLIDGTVIGHGTFLKRL